jgi:hypothetical protein
LDQRFRLVPDSFPEDPRFNHTEVPTKEEAVAEAKRTSSDYVLLLQLGEFRNAAPMTFRSDMATLDSGVVYSASTGEPVWRIEEPLSVSGSNIGNHLPFISDFGKQVAKSIADTPGGPIAPRNAAR